MRFIEVREPGRGRRAMVRRQVGAVHEAKWRVLRNACKSRRAGDSPIARIGRGFRLPGSSSVGGSDRPESREGRRIPAHRSHSGFALETEASAPPLAAGGSGSFGRPWA